MKIRKRKVYVVKTLLKTPRRSKMTELMVEEIVIENLPPIPPHLIQYTVEEFEEPPRCRRPVVLIEEMDCDASDLLVTPIPPTVTVEEPE